MERACHESPLFRELCEDYRDCLAALHHCKQLAANDAIPRWQEYQELLVELGGEIQIWLQAMDNEACRRDPQGEK